MQKFLWQFGLIFAGAGMLFGIIGAWFIFDDVYSTSKKIKVQGTVISAAKNSVIEFEMPENGLKNKKYQATTRVSSSPPAYHLGESVIVYANPEDPSDAIIDGVLERWFVPLFMFSLLIIFGGIGFVSLIAYFKRKQAQMLVLTGVRVEGKVLKVIQSNSLKINDEAPWYLEVAVINPISGMNQKIKSHYFLEKPAHLPGKNIRVYYNPRRQDHYYIDDSAA